MTGVSESYSRLLQLAALLFDSKDAMIRVDVSEYSEKYPIARLIGTPPDQFGHNSGWTADGVGAAQTTHHRHHQRDREGITRIRHVVGFRRTVIVMTSNLGAAYLNDMGGGPVRP